LRLFAECAADIVWSSVHLELDFRTFDQVTVADEVLVPVLIIKPHVRDENIKCPFFIFQITCVYTYILSVLKMNDSILEERCTDGILVCSWTNRIKSKGSL
jgi:hypothetical protein